MAKLGPIEKRKIIVDIVREAQLENKKRMQSLAEGPEEWSHREEKKEEKMGEGKIPSPEAIPGWSPGEKKG